MTSLMFSPYTSTLGSTDISDYKGTFSIRMDVPGLTKSDIQARRATNVLAQLTGTALLFVLTAGDHA